ncbi:DUF188 domain-containing protein [Lagierella sp.]|uniref:DUF188 domain-containing protein n=1 Tax=Lagierella sp. TaxID=2849657 RepID=UPI00262EA286|nr:DUF188 domain-containing protein [Lagierella sp.]
MIIYVDGDSCPVISIIKNICEKKGIEYMVVKDFCHELNLPEENCVTVDSEKDSADLFIANRIEDGDFLITNDMGLASVVLGKDVTVINFYGEIINEYNVNAFLFQRHISQRERKNNIYRIRHKKRSQQNDDDFERVLLSKLTGGKYEA